MPVAKSVSIRLGTDGKAEVKRDFAELKADGVQAFQAVGDAANQASQTAEAASARQLASYRRMADQMRQLEAQRQSQASFNSVLGFGGSGAASARDSAAVFIAQAAAEEQLAARTAALRAEIDPAWAAQQRFNQAVGNADELLAAGTITQAEHAAAVKLGKAALDDAEKAAAALAAGTALTSMQMSEMGGVAHRTWDSLAAGMPVERVLTMEGGRLAAALGSGPGGIGAAVSTASGLFMRFLPIIAGVTAVVGGGVLVYSLIKKEIDDAAASAKRFQDAQVETSNALKSTEQWARTTAPSVDLLGDAYHRAAAAAKELAVNTLLAATSHLDTDIMDRQSKLEQLRTQRLATSSLGRGDLGAGRGLPSYDSLALSQSFGAVRDPTLDAELAQRKQLTDQLSKIMGQPTEAFADIKALGESLDPTGQKIKEVTEKVAALHAAMNDPAQLAKWGVTRDVLAQQAEAGEKEIAQLKKRQEGTDRHAAALIRDAASMEANAAGSIALAQAYLQSDGAALLAEARRKALTDATKKGIDVDAQAHRQLMLNLAEEAVAGAKQVNDLRGHTAAQKLVNDMIAGGLAPATMASQLLQDELALRPLLTAADKAEGETKKALAADIAAYAAARARANAEDARSAALAAELSANDNVRLSQIRQLFAGDRSGAGALALAKAQGETAADKAGASVYAILEAYFRGDQAAAGSLLTSRNSFISSAVRPEQAKQAADRADYLAQAGNSLADQAETLQRQLDLVTATNAVRDSELAKLKLIQDFQAQGLDTSTDQAKALIAQNVALELQKAKLADIQASWQELQQFGGQLTGDLLYALSPDHWMAWGDEGKAVLRDLAAEFEKLAVVNPIMNALFGQGLPTLGSTGGLIGSLFKGGGAGGAGSLFSTAFGNANGTDDFPGGRTMIAEGGPEEVWLPPGSRISTAAQTRRALTGAGAAAGPTVNLAVTLNAQGAGPREIEALKATVEQLQRDLPGVIITTVSNAQDRNILRPAA